MRSDSLCIVSGEMSPLALDANNALSYVFMSPVLAIGGVKEACPSVEARAKANGAVYARVGKGHIEPFQGTP